MNPKHILFALIITVLAIVGGLFSTLSTPQAGSSSESGKQAIPVTNAAQSTSTNLQEAATPDLQSAAKISPKDLENVTIQ